MDERAIVKLVGRNIRARRKMMKFTQSELADAAGISRSNLQRYELGLVKTGPSYIHFKKIAKALKCTEHDLNDGKL